MSRILDFAMRHNGNGHQVQAEPRLGSVEIQKLHVRKVRDLYQYHKLSEWIFDLCFRALLNFGNWVTAVAYALKSGYSCFHSRRDDFADERRMQPPVYVSDAQASRHLKELEGKVSVIVR